MTNIGKIFSVTFIFVKIIISFLIYPFSSKKDTIIIGTRNGNSGYDNGEILFEYFLKKGIKSHFLIYNNPENYNNNIIKKNSIKSILKIINAKYIYITHSESDILSYLWRIFKYKKYIFIQHGVIGIKCLPEYQKKNYYKYISSNQYETNIFLNTFNLKKENIIQCGLPRFDNYSIKHNSKIFSCLIMFTWRKYKSEKKINYTEIISALKKSNPDIKIYIANHDMCNQYNNNIKDVIYISNIDLPNIIKNTDLLITDYSSISWDYLYQNKYIWFYHYDHDEYIINEGTYCNFDHFFGYRTYENFHPSSNNIINEIILRNNINNTSFLKQNYFYLHGNDNHIKTLVDETKNE